MTCTYLCAAYPWGTGRPRRGRGHGVVGRLQKPLPVPLVLVKDGPLLRRAFVAEGPSEQTPLGAGLFSILASLLVAARGGPLRREQAEGPDERGHLPKLKHGRRSFSLSLSLALSLSLSLFSESAGGRSLSLSLRWLRPGSANVPVEGNGMLEGILKQSILVPSGRLFVCFDSG